MSKMSKSDVFDFVVEFISGDQYTPVFGASLAHLYGSGDKDLAVAHLSNVWLASDSKKQRVPLVLGLVRCFLEKFDASVMIACFDHLSENLDATQKEQFAMDVEQAYREPNMLITRKKKKQEGYKIMPWIYRHLGKRMSFIFWIGAFCDDFAENGHGFEQNVVEYFSFLKGEPMPPAKSILPEDGFYDNKTGRSRAIERFIYGDESEKVSRRQTFLIARLFRAFRRIGIRRYDKFLKEHLLPHAVFSVFFRVRGMRRALAMAFGVKYVESVTYHGSTCSASWFIEPFFAHGHARVMEKSGHYAVVSVDERRFLVRMIENAVAIEDLPPDVDASVALVKAMA